MFCKEFAIKTSTSRYLSRPEQNHQQLDLLVSDTWLDTGIGGCVTLHPRIFHPFTFILGFSSSGFFILGFFILSIFILALSSSHFHPRTFILALSSLHFSSPHFHPCTFILALSSSHFHPHTFILTLSSPHFHTYKYQNVNTVTNIHVLTIGTSEHSFKSV